MAKTRNPRNATATVEAHARDRAIAVAIKKELAPFAYLPERVKLLEQQVRDLRTWMDHGVKPVP